MNPGQITQKGRKNALFSGIRLWLIISHFAYSYAFILTVCGGHYESRTACYSAKVRGLRGEDRFHQ